MSAITELTENEIKSSAIHGVFSNRDYPDGSVLASANFQRDVTISGALICTSLDSALALKANIADLNTLMLGKADVSYVDQRVTELVDSSPATLDTLNELAAALGDDPNFATTVATSIGTKLAKSNDTVTNLTLSGSTYNNTNNFMSRTSATCWYMPDRNPSTDYSSRLLLSGNEELSLDNPTASQFRIRFGPANTSRFTLTSSGNLTLVGNFTAVNGTFSGSLSSPTITTINTSLAANAAAVALKPDTSDVISALALKADISAVNAALALKVNASALATTNTTVSLKADTTDVTAGLALKADASDLVTTNTAVSLKADTSVMTSALALKADASDLATTNTAVSLKADTSTMTSALALKADASALATTNTAVALKANQASITNVDNVRDLDKPISTSTQAALDLKADLSLLDNISNTSDPNKPISIATQAALDLKADLTLISNINNTSDAAKPISSATQTALNLKANQSSITNINNTSDVNKPISSATQTALNLKANQASISNINNTSDAAKPVSTAQQAALDLKANLSLISNVNNTSDATKPVSTAQQAALDLKANLSLISNVNNTSDAAKPVSTATQTALDLKLNKANDTLSNVNITGGSSGLNGSMYVSGSGNLYWYLAANTTSSPSCRMVLAGYNAFVWDNYTATDIRFRWGSTNTQKHTFNSNGDIVIAGNYTGVNSTLTGTLNCGLITSPSITNFQSSLALLTATTAPIMQPTFTNFVKINGYLELTGNITGPYMDTLNTTINSKISKVSPKLEGIAYFKNSGGVTYPEYGTDNMGGICSNFSNGKAELSFINGGFFSSAPLATAFSWFLATSTTTATELATMLNNGTMSFIGNVVAPNITAIQNTITGYATSFNTGKLRHTLRCAAVEVVTASKTYTTSTLVDTIVVRGAGCVLTLPFINDVQYSGATVLVYSDGPYSGEIRVTGDQVRYGGGDLSNHPAYYFATGRTIKLMAIPNLAVGAGYCMWTVIQTGS